VEDYIDEKNRDERSHHTLSLLSTTPFCKFVKVYPFLPRKHTQYECNKAPGEWRQFVDGYSREG
jgi:hypothetical protein